MYLSLETSCFSPKIWTSPWNPKEPSRTFILTPLDLHLDPSGSDFGPQLRIISNVWRSEERDSGCLSFINPLPMSREWERSKRTWMSQHDLPHRSRQNIAASNRRVPTWGVKSFAKQDMHRDVPVADIQRITTDRPPIQNSLPLYWPAKNQMASCHQRAARVARRVPFTASNRAWRSGEAFAIVFIVIKHRLGTPCRPSHVYGSVKPLGGGGGVTPQATSIKSAAPRRGAGRAGLRTKKRRVPLLEALRNPLFN